MKIDFKSRKILIGLISLLGIGTTAGVVAITTGGNTSSSNPTSSSSGSSSGGIPSSNEEQVIRDFEFSNGQFIGDAYPENFQPYRFIDDGEGGSFGVGRLASSMNDNQSVPSVVRIGDNLESLWSYNVDLGHQEGVTYSNDNYSSQFTNGALLDSGDLLVFGDVRGHLLLDDNSTRVALGGIFEGENIPTSTNRVFFYGVISLEGTFTLIDYLTTTSGGDAYITDMYALGDDEFLIIGRTSYTTGIFEGIELSQNNNVSYIGRFALEANVLVTRDLHQINANNQTFVNRTFLHNDLLVLNSHAYGSIEGYPLINYASSENYPLFIGFNVATFEVEWMTAVDDLKQDNMNSQTYANAYNVALGHDGNFLGISQLRNNNTNYVSTFISEITPQGNLVGVTNLGEPGTNSTYFIGRTKTGYFTLGNTRATSGPYASAGQEDLYLTLLNKDFEITSFEVWGGEGFDAMSSWPTVLNSGILVFAATTNSTTGNLATALNKTESTPKNFLIVLS